MQGICIRQVLTPWTLFAKRLFQKLMNMGCKGIFHILPPERQTGQGEAVGNTFPFLFDHPTVDPEQGQCQKVFLILTRTTRSGFARFN